MGISMKENSKKINLMAKESFNILMGIDTRVASKTTRKMDTADTPIQMAIDFKATILRTRRKVWGFSLQVQDRHGVVTIQGDRGMEISRRSVLTDASQSKNGIWAEK
jgi:hypothetical protein